MLKLASPYEPIMAAPLVLQQLVRMALLLPTLGTAHAAEVVGGCGTEFREQFVVLDIFAAKR